MDAALTAAAIALLLLAAFTDLRGRLIPNRLVLALAALGALRLGLDAASGASAASAASVAAALALLALGTAAFRFRLMGGGDVKLIAAAALWLGLPALPPFLVVTALAGGVLAGVYLVAGLAAARRGAPRPSLPYGVAIAAGGIAASLPPA